MTSSVASTGISDAVTNFASVIGSVGNIFLQNPVLLVFVAAGFIGVGVTLFRKLKKAG